MTKIERMMRVNSLAARAKTDRSITFELFELVEPWIRVVCKRYCNSDSGNRLYELEDLCQSAFFGFLKAIESYDPDRGAFSTMLAWHVQHTCRSEIGLRGKRDPLYDSLSLNKPLSEDESEAEHIDLLTDPDAEKPFDEVTDVIYNMELRGVLDECMEQIPQEDAALLRARYYDGIKYKDLATTLATSKEGARQTVGKALKKMLKPMSARRYQSYRQCVIDKSSSRSEIGYSPFHDTWYSCVERAAEALILRGLAVKHDSHTWSGLQKP